MTCKTPFPEERWEEIKRDLSQRSCPHCGHIGLIGGDAALPLDKSLLSMWTCHHCKAEIAFVVSEKGEVYRA